MTSVPTGGDRRPSVWDTGTPSKLTRSVCELGVAAWTQARGAAQLPAPSARSFATLRRALHRSLADEERRPQRWPQLAQDSAATPPAALAEATAARLVLVGELDELPLPERWWQVVGFAAVDAVARRSDLGDRQLADAFHATTAVAGPLQALFSHDGTVPAERAWVSVATLAAGVGVGLLTGGPGSQGAGTERLRTIVGLLASCTGATGPAISEDPQVASWLLGRAASNVVLAVALVDEGYTANPRALEAPRGLLRAVTGSVPTPETVTATFAAAEPPGGRA